MTEQEARERARIARLMVENIDDDDDDCRLVIPITKIHEEEVPSGMGGLQEMTMEGGKE